MGVGIANLAISQSSTKLNILPCNVLVADVFPENHENMMDGYGSWWFLGHCSTPTIFIWYVESCPRAHEVPIL